MIHLLNPSVMCRLRVTCSVLAIAQPVVLVWYQACMCVCCIDVKSMLNESGQVPLSDPLSEVLRPKFGLRPDLSQETC